MTRDITAGQYIPGHSLMHRLDPRVKITLTFLFIIMVFISRSPASLGFMVTVLAVLIGLSGVSIRQVFTGIRPLIPVIIFTALMNLFYVRGEPLLSFYFIHISREGLFVGLSLMIRLTAMIAGSSLITYTTSLNALAAGLEQMLRPLRKLHLRVDDLAMIVTLSLRFIPTLADEIGRITDAQKARGAEIGSGHLIRRIQSYAPIILPLFMSSFRRAFELTNAIESRCYHGGSQRTRLTVLKLNRNDVLALILFLIAFCTGLFLNLV
ncbi:energy-coupling factor transporter transmembrane component T [Sporolactobacillus sp. Y61]|uniref:Energy-coupling factor transporter transmembrane component T n=1 Tax=Sporolactobacillus sp. Y61 TaxID=3160863 RepID=A0AAU8IBJ3_9BACL